jgi:glucose-1-phosphate adenylyltransferase
MQTLSDSSETPKNEPPPGAAPGGLLPIGVETLVRATRPQGRQRAWRQAPVGKRAGVDYRPGRLVPSNPNDGYKRIAVLTQYQSHSLDRQVTTTWRLSPLLGNYVTAGLLVSLTEPPGPDAAHTALGRRERLAAPLLRRCIE